VLFSSNLPEWGRHGLVSELQGAFGLSLSVENDANLAALGERSFGWGASASTFVYITIGTGVGMGIVINGTLYRGARGAAGEIGFLPFGLNKDSEESGKISESYLGMFEEATSARGIVRLAQELGLPASCLRSRSLTRHTRAIVKRLSWSNRRDIVWRRQLQPSLPF
jgi:predicted NBD/HSP70 family sugar kinase